MKTIVENAKEFVSSIRLQHPDISIFKTEFVAIGEDGIIRLSPYTDYLMNARMGIVICYYNYLVITAPKVAPKVAPKTEKVAPKNCRRRNDLI